MLAASQLSPDTNIGNLLIFVDVILLIISNKQLWVPSSEWNRLPGDGANSSVNICSRTRWTKHNLGSRHV